MSEFALLIDFGSTYTKLRAINLSEATLIASSQGPSTVTTDINIGMKLALHNLEASIGYLPNFKYRLASSSAAGGLKMVTIGLVKELTLEAAKRAALGAGAKLIGGFANRLTSGDIKNIVKLNPDIILLAGGTDGGDSQVVIHNSFMLGKSSIECPIIFAGNRSATDDVINNLMHKIYIVCENVMPEFNELNTDSARAAIRDVFIDQIVHAKGIDKAREQFTSVLMPTPSAVLEGARLIADGFESEEGLGELIVIDPGGATTDVHSVASGTPSQQGVIQRGLPEARLKRTVEGDLGMRHNAITVLEVCGSNELAKHSGLAEDKIHQMIHFLSENPESLPTNSDEKMLDEALASAALRIAMKRHCGSLEVVYTALGPVTAQDGKDLGAIKTIIGTGGVLAYSNQAKSLLEGVLANPEDPNSLRPKAPQILIDSHYIVYAAGLLSQVNPSVALNLAKKYLLSQ